MTQAYATSNDAPLAYATPIRGGPSPVWAGFWVLAGGLGMVFLGGCFCLGILLLVTNAMNNGFHSPVAWTSRDTLLMVVLYAVAFACFAAGAVMLVAAVRKLLAVGRV